MSESNSFPKWPTDSKVDNPIKEEQILGKTVKIVSKAFILAKVFPLSWLIRFLTFSSMKAFGRFSLSILQMLIR